LALLQHGGLLVLKGGTHHFMFQPGVCHEFRMNAEGFAAAADWGKSPASSQASSSRSSFEDHEQPQPTATGALEQHLGMLNSNSCNSQQQQLVAVTVSAANGAEADPSREVIVTVTVGPAVAAAKVSQDPGSKHTSAAAPTPMQSGLGSNQPPPTAAPPDGKDPHAAADGNVFVNILMLFRHGSSKQQWASSQDGSSGSHVECSTGAAHATAV
jgi:hypothetical protein